MAIIVFADGTFADVTDAYLIYNDDFPQDKAVRFMSIMAFGKPDERVDYADEHGVSMEDVIHRAGYVV